MGSSIIIAFIAFVALVLVGFGAGIAAVPLLLIAVSIPAVAALGRRYLKTKRVRDFRSRSDLSDGIHDPTAKDGDEPIHGPVG